MDNKSDTLPWDYFLTNYERDLLRLPFEEITSRYPKVHREQIESDLVKTQENQLYFEQKNGQD